MAFPRPSRVIKLIVMPCASGDPYNHSADEIDGPMKDMCYSQSWLSTYCNDEKLGRKDLEVKTRRISQNWPRDPQGPTLSTWPVGMRGKHTPDGTFLNWGATLADFYAFRRITGASSEALTIYTSGSKLSSCMELIGGEDCSAKLVEWQSFEPNPRRIEPRNVLHNINIVDKIKHDRARRPVLSSFKDAGDLEESAMNLPKPFHWDKYCIRPRTPFEDQRPWIQQRIPFHLLPKKLHIHDPDGVIQSSQRFAKMKKDPRWPLNPDAISATYDLKLSSRGKKKAAEERTNSKHLQKPLEGLFCPPECAVTRTSPMRLVSPPPFYAFSSKPAPPEFIPEAHLYLDANHKIGEGNRSKVYSAELELPLQCLADPEVCRLCAEREIISAHAGRSCRVPSKDYITSELYEVEWTSSNPLPLHCSLLEPISSSSKCPISVGVMTLQASSEKYRALQLIDEQGLDPRTRTVENESKRDYHQRVSAAHLETVLQSEKALRYSYIGPLQIIELKTPWHIPGISEPCHHFKNQNCPTTTVRLAAKLSDPNDDHMTTEARNYEMFPPYFFEHWSGYYIVPPIPDPVPLGALVPQYYGHYIKPAMDASVDPSYLPLMLIEYCGTQAEPEELAVSDRQECFSLIRRFHIEGWMHNSPYPRNFLVQDGPIGATLEERKVKGVERKVFRLIDFGRSIDPQSRGDVNSKENEDETTYEETRVKHCKVESWANVSATLGKALKDVLR
ncbi:hypothetical protein DL96DRAFT_1531665 [Flagelloscypha sp. PMI_526]|nr:hypothetical protein DL96DRAFT_1531665 [Flagelloscypha sp. PMI_526]